MKYIIYFIGLFLAFPSFYPLEIESLISTPFKIQSISYFLIVVFLILNIGNVIHENFIKRKDINFIFWIFGIYLLGSLLSFIYSLFFSKELHISVFSFTLTPLLLYIIPYFSIKCFSFVDKGPYFFLKGIFHSLFLILLLYIFQYSYLFDFSSILNDFYSVIFKYTESRWGGWGGGIATNYPLIMEQLRPAAGFPEPSVLASYLSIVILPLLLTNCIYKFKVINVYFSGGFGLIICLLLLFFSYSTTAYFSLCIFIIVYLFSLYKNTIFNLYISLLIFFFFLVLLLFCFQNNIGVLINNSMSLQTRIGGLYGGFVEFLSYPIGYGFGISNVMLGEFIPAWAYNLEYIKQSSDHWFVHTSFIIQIITTFGFFSVLIFIPFIKMINNLLKGLDRFSRTYIKIFMIFLVVSAYSVIFYQDVWFISIVIFIFDRKNLTAIFKDGNNNDCSKW